MLKASTPNVPLESSRLLVTSGDPLAFLVVSDSILRQVAAGMGHIQYSGPPGIYRIEVRVPGRQQQQRVILEPARECQVRVDQIPWQSVIPTRDNPLCKRLWEGETGFPEIAARETKLRKRAGRLVVYAWSPETQERPIASFRIRKENGPIGWFRRTPQWQPEGSSENGFLVFDKQLVPGTYEVVFSVPGLGQRGQSVFVEAGWTTQIFAHATADRNQLECSVDFATAVIVLRRDGAAFEADRATFYRETEAALDALYFGHVGVPGGGDPLGSETPIDEPIRALAVGYAHLAPYLSLLDAPLEANREVSDSSSRPRPSDDEQAELQAVANLGQRLVDLLPHSIDARLLVVAALWLKHGLFHISAERPSWVLRVIRALRRPLPVRLILELVGLVFAIVFGLLILAADGETFVRAIGIALGISALASYTGIAETVFASVWVAGILLPLGGVVATDWFRTLWRYGPLVQETPIFAQGMDLLLRLAALEDEICTAGSNVVDNALRLTADSLWTRWDDGRSPQKAREDFREALRELVAGLESAAGSRESEPNAPGNLGEVRDRAFRYLATALRVPLSFLRRQLNHASRTMLEGILKTPPQSLRVQFEERLRALSSITVADPALAVGRRPRWKTALWVLFLVIPVLTAILFRESVMGDGSQMVYLWGVFVLAGLLILYGLLGGTWNPLGLICGADGRSSSSKLQLLLWTIVAIYAYVTVYAARLKMGIYRPVDEVPVQLLTAMGLSAVTAAAAKGITVGYVATGRLNKTSPSATKTTGGLFVDDEGNPDLAKIQMLAWTFIALGVYLITLFHQVAWILANVRAVDGGVDPAQAALVGLPDISPALVVLMGLGQGAYLGNKLVTIETPRLTGLIPSAGRPGATVALTGESLGTSDSPPIITINGSPLPTPATANGDKWSFVFPAQQPDGSPWPPGPVRIGVLAQGRMSVNDLPFTVLVPRITALTPDLGKPPLEVVITGLDFGDKAENCVVTLNGKPSHDPTPITLLGNGQLRFKFPEKQADGTAWPPGSVAIGVTIDGRPSANTLAFSVVLG